MTDNDINFWLQSVSIALGVSVHITSTREEILEIFKDSPFFNLTSKNKLVDLVNEYVSICADKSSYFIEGPLNIYFSIICLDKNSNKNLVIGPFVNSFTSMNEILEVKSFVNFDNYFPDEINRYYNTIPMVENPKLISLINLFLEKYFNTTGPFPILLINKKNLIGLKVNLEDISFKSIENQYNLENEFLKYISQGNFSKACITFKNLVLDSSGEYKAESYFLGASGFFILNTMLKKAAEAGGVHPIYLYPLFKRYTLLISSNKDLNIDMTIKMIKDYCSLVNKSSSSYTNPLLKKIIAYINYNLSSNLTVAGISHDFGITSNYLYCLFKKEMGISAIEFINKTRIDEASRLMRETDMTIQNIAESVGINDTSYFARLFKKYIGVTPSRYKKLF